MGDAAVALRGDARAGVVICLDVSNWDKPTFDGDGFAAHGVTELIVGCQDETAGREMVAGAQAAGIEVIATYAFLYFGFDGFMGFQDLITFETEKAIRVAKAAGLRWVALDVEANGANERSGDTPDVRLADLRKAIALVEGAGLKVFIYTGGWYWPSYMGNSTEFAGYPLWHSEYPDDGHRVNEVAYGGWGPVSIHQYTSGLKVAGRGRDANYIFIRFFEEEEMTDEERRQLDAVYQGMFAGDRAVEDSWNANGVGTAQSVISIERALNRLADELTGIDNLTNLGDALIAAGNAIKERTDG